MQLEGAEGGLGKGGPTSLCDAAQKEGWLSGGSRLLPKEA